MRRSLLPIFAVAVMLLTATTAHAYQETWDGWFISGTLSYGGTNYYQSERYSGYAYDSTLTGGSYDTFYYFATVTNFQFVNYPSCTDTIYLVVPYLGMPGHKETGTSGTKEGSGEWWGTLCCPDQNYSVWGTWTTQTTGGGFNYNNNTYLASWTITGGDMGHPTGGGTSYGSKQ